MWWRCNLFCDVSKRDLLLSYDLSCDHLSDLKLGDWFHNLSDQKLADTNFRTPACIDLLLVAEVIASILLGGRRTGPRGTPSEINTCFGWVLFGKIQGSDVVNVANLTLEQDMLKDMTGSRRSYAAVLTADKKRDLCYLRRRNKWVVEGQPHTLRHEFNHPDCWIPQQGLGRSRISQCARNIERTAKKRWKGTWETKGFRPAGCWCHIATNWSLSFVDCNHCLYCECS